MTAYEARRGMAIGPQEHARVRAVCEHHAPVGCRVPRRVEHRRSWWWACEVGDAMKARIIAALFDPSSAISRELAMSPRVDVALATASLSMARTIKPEPFECAALARPL